jgi:hypothetical protein
MPCPLVVATGAFASLSSRGEKNFQDRCGFVGQNSGGHFYAMVQLRVI